MTLTNVSKQWAWPGSRDPVNFWPLNGNSSKMAINIRTSDLAGVFRHDRDKCFRKVCVAMQGRVTP